MSNDASQSFEADPYLRIVMLFDQDPTAGSFLRVDGEGGFAGAIHRMAREIDTLRALLKPFAEAMDTHGDNPLLADSASVLWGVRDGKLTVPGISLGDLRRARAHLDTRSGGE